MISSTCGFLIKLVVLEGAWTTKLRHLLLAQHIINPSVQDIVKLAYDATLLLQDLQTDRQRGKIALGDYFIRWHSDWYYLQLMTWSAISDVKFMHNVDKRLYQEDRHERHTS